MEFWMFIIKIDRLYLIVLLACPFLVPKSCIALVFIDIHNTLLIMSLSRWHLVHIHEWT